jgi:hypothetical protein
MGHLRWPLRFGVALALVADCGLEEPPGDGADVILVIRFDENRPTTLVLAI